MDCRRTKESAGLHAETLIWQPIQEVVLVATSVKKAILAKFHKDGRAARYLDRLFFASLERGST